MKNIGVIIALSAAIWMFVILVVLVSLIIVSPVKAETLNGQGLILNQLPEKTISLEVVEGWF